MTPCADGPVEVDPPSADERDPMEVNDDPSFANEPEPIHGYRSLYLIYHHIFAPSSAKFHHPRQPQQSSTRLSKNFSAVYHQNP